MKSPPFQVSDERAHELTALFIDGRVGAKCISDPEAPIKAEPRTQALPSESAVELDGVAVSSEA